MSTAVNPLQPNNLIPGSGSLSQYSSALTELQSAQTTPIKSTGKLAAAKAKAQAEFTPVPKTKTATIKSDRGTYTYDYADLADVLGMALPILAKHGIAFSQPFKRREGKLYLVTQIQLGDEIETDDGLAIPEAVRPQEQGAYTTYARRYGASSLLGIVSEADIDGPPPEGRQSEKPSTSGQQISPAPTAPPAEVKRGRPASVPNPSTTVPKSSTVAPVEPPAQAAPPIATDDDVPSNIGGKPSKDEMAAIKTRLKSFELDNDALKTFVLKSTGREAARDLTLNEWNETLAKLDLAKQEGRLAEVIK